MMSYIKHTEELLLNQTSFDKNNGRMTSDILQLVEQYSCFVFLVCMKYFKDEEKSRSASVTIFKKLNGKLKNADNQTIKQILYQATKKHCIKELC